MGTRTSAKHVNTHTTVDSTDDTITLHLVYFKNTCTTLLLRVLTRFTNLAQFNELLLNTHIIVIDTHLYYIYNIKFLPHRVLNVLINTQHTCTRVIVVILSVCLSVCCLSRFDFGDYWKLTVDIDMNLLRMMI